MKKRDKKKRLRKRKDRRDNAEPKPRNELPAPPVTPSE